MDLVESQLRRVTTAVDRADQRAALIFGVNRADLGLLDLLASRGAQTAGALARAAGITSGGMTSALDRLGRAGYVKRQRHPTDRRSIVVQVTPAISGPSQEAVGPLQVRMAKELGRYRSGQLEIVALFLEHWGDAIEATLRT